MGVKEDIPLDAGVIIHKIKYGTDNMAHGPAMAKQEAIQSIEVGIRVATEEIIKGADVLGTGEMGIGNTTPSRRDISCFNGMQPYRSNGVWCRSRPRRHCL